MINRPKGRPALDDATSPYNTAHNTINGIETGLNCLLDLRTFDMDIRTDIYSVLSKMDRWRKGVGKL